MRENSAHPAQASAYFVHASAPGPEFRNVQLSLSLGETCSAERIQSAWRQAAAAHGILRTSFRKAPTGELLRREADETEITWRTLDWTAVPPSELSANWTKEMEDDAARPIDPDAPTLLRCLLINLPGGHCHLLITFPSFLLDEDCLFHVLCEWLEALEGRVPSPGPETEASSAPAATPTAADWWTQFFSSSPEPARLQVLPAAPVRDESRRLRTEMALDRELSKKLKALSQKLGIPVRDVFLASWSLVLSRLTSRNRVVMLAPIRPNHADPGPTGLHENILPFQAALNGGQSVEAFLKEISRSERERSENSAIPLERVLVLAEPPRRLGDFATAFQWMPPTLNDRIHDTFPRWINLDARLHRRSLPPLTLEVRDGNRFSLELEDGEFLSKDDAGRLLARIALVLETFAETPSRRLSEVRILSDAEWDAFKEAESAGAPPRSGLRIEEQIAATVAVQPDANAVEGPDDGALTYAEVDSHANSLAAWLSNENLSEGWNIGVCLTPTPWLPVAVLGILRAGDTCLPLEPMASRDWLLQKIEGCDVELVLCDSFTARHFEGSQKRVLILDQQWETVSAVPVTSATANPPKAAFFLTGTESGSAPALPALSPAVVAASCRKLIDLLGIEPGHRVPLLPAAGTGAYVETLLATLAGGATLVLPGKAEPIPADSTHLRLSAAQWRTWTARCARTETGIPDVLRSVCVEAAPFPTRIHGIWRERNAGRARWIQYAGPAGLCGRSVRFVSEEGAEDYSGKTDVPIGDPGPGVKARLLDPEGQPLPAHHPGTLEIVVEGKSASFPGWRDGSGVFHLSPSPFGPLEQALCGLPEIIDAHAAEVVVDGHPRLCAWVVNAMGTSGEQPELVTAVRQVLPSGPIPDFIAAVPEFPLTAAGEFDLPALPKPSPRPAPQAQQAPTARAVQAAPPREWQPLVLLHKTPDAPALFLIHDRDGHPDKYRSLAALLAPDWTIYATSARGLTQPSACHPTIESEAASLVEAICLLDPEGPYHLVGWDFGAILAMEMTRQLRVAGRNVPYLAMAGARPPETSAKPGWKQSLTRLFARGGVPEPAPSSPVARAHAEALKEYRARPLDGAAGIILAADQGADIEDAWLACAPEAFVERMSCQAREMLTEPAVKRLAVILRECALPNGDDS